MNPHNLSLCYKALDRDFSDNITTLCFLGFDDAELVVVQLTTLFFSSYPIFPDFGSETHKN